MPNRLAQATSPYLAQHQNNPGENYPSGAATNNIVTIVPSRTSGVYQIRSLPKAHKGFVDPSGQPVNITNLSAFCRDHGLHVVHMHGLKSGKRRSHKGWTWRIPDE